MTRARLSRSGLVPITVAGSDPTAGAGVEADLKTFLAHGLSGVGVITALTTQSRRGVSRVDAILASRVAERLELLFDEFEIGGVKTGLLPNADVVAAVARVLRRRTPRHLVVDPVLAPSHGRRFLDGRGRAALVERLFPLAELVTPNVPEAAALAGMTEAAVRKHPERATAILRGFGARAVVLKGGHTEGAGVVELLDDGRVIHAISARRVVNRRSGRPQSMHGTGCLFSAVLLAERIAGASRIDATRGAGAAVRAALRRLARANP